MPMVVTVPPNFKRLISLLLRTKKKTSACLTGLLQIVLSFCGNWAQLTGKQRASNYQTIKENMVCSIYHQIHSGMSLAGMWTATGIMRKLKEGTGILFLTLNHLRGKPA